MRVCYTRRCNYNHTYMLYHHNGFMVTVNARAVDVGTPARTRAWVTRLSVRRRRRAEARLRFWSPGRCLFPAKPGPGRCAAAGGSCGAASAAGNPSPAAAHRAEPGARSPASQLFHRRSSRRGSPPRHDAERFARRGFGRFRQGLAQRGFQRASGSRGSPSQPTRSHLRDSR